MKKIQDKLALRRAKTQQLSEKLLSMGYQKTDLTISVQKANTSAALTAAPLVMCVVVLYLLTAGWQGLLNVEWDLLGVIILLLIIVHELIHGLFFALFAPSHSRAVTFGMMWKSLNPYCYCAEPVNKVQYLIASLAPCFILGVATGAVAIATGSATWLLGCVVSLLCASGDLLVALKLISFIPEGKDALFVDHPDLPGLMAFVK